FPPRMGALGRARRERGSLHVCQETRAPALGEGSEIGERAALRGADARGLSACRGGDPRRVALGLGVPGRTGASRSVFRVVFGPQERISHFPGGGGACASV